MSPSRRRVPLPHPPGPPRRTLVAGCAGLARVPAVVVVLVLALVAGCGVRLETPPPAPLTPGRRRGGPAARVRRRRRAGGPREAVPPSAPAPEPAADPADPVAAARAAVATQAATHLDLLGGLYDDGLDPHRARRPPGRPRGHARAPDPAPDARARPRPRSRRSSTALTDAAATARTDLATVARRRPGPPARVARRPRGCSRRPGWPPRPGSPRPPVPDVVVPAGAADRAWPAARSRTLVAAEDAAGYALEVVAAKHPGDLRARAGAARRRAPRSGRRRGREAGDDRGTGARPAPRRLRATRRARGPRGRRRAGRRARDDPGRRTTRRWSAGSAPGARGALADAVAEATAQAVGLGRRRSPALPGLPEHAGR